MNSPKASILWIAENSTERQKWLISHVNAIARQGKKKCLIFDHRFMEGAPETLKNLVLHTYFSKIEAEDIIIMREEALQDSALRKKTVRPLLHWTAMSSRRWIWPIGLFPAC
jgi:hypothetical protein